MPLERLRRLFKKEEKEGLYLLNADERAVNPYRDLSITGPIAMGNTLRELKGLGKKEGEDKRWMENERWWRLTLASMFLGEKPVAYVPLQEMYLEGARNIRRRLKEEFGRRLKALAVVGEALTPAMSGVPLKAVPRMNPETGEKEWALRNYMGSTKLVIMLDRIKPKDRYKVQQIIGEELEKIGIPPYALLDMHSLHILTPRDHGLIAKLFHRKRPVAFFSEEEKKYVEKLLRSKKIRILAEREALGTREVDYKGKIDEKFKEEFERVLDEMGEEGEKQVLSDDEQIIYNNLETFLHLYDSPYFREMLDEAIQSSLQRDDIKNLRVSEANRRIRMALAKVLWKYMNASMDTTDFSMGKLFGLKNIRKFHRRMGEIAGRWK